MTTPPNRAGRTARHATIYVLADVTLKGVAALLTPLYVRYLSPSDYGVLAVVASITVLLTVVLGLSLQTAVARLHFTARDDEHRRQIYGSVLVVIVVFPAAACLLIEIAGRAGALDVFANVPYSPYIRLAMATSYCALLPEFAVGLFGARFEPRRVVLLTASNVACLIAATLVFVVVLEQGPLGAVRAGLVASAIMAAFALMMVLPLVNLRPAWPVVAGALAFALPLVPQSIAHWGIHLADRLVLQGIVSARELGIYSLAVSIGLVLQLVVNGSQRAFGPAMTEALDENDLRATAQLGSRWLLAIVALGAAWALIADPLVLLVLTPEFAAVRDSIPWIVGSFVAYGIYAIGSTGTWYSMRTRLVPILTLIALALNLAAVVVLAPGLGAEGAAIASMIGFGALAIMQMAYSQHLHHIPWDYGTALRIVIACLAVYLVCSWVTSAMGPAVSLSVRLIGIVTLLPIALLIARVPDLFLLERVTKWRSRG